MKPITNLLLVIIILLQASNLFAHNGTRNCGSMEVLEQQLKADPAMQFRMDQIEQFTNSFIANQKSKSSQRNTAATITIPVVVHVLYRTTAENISDAQVLSQITILNQDFAGTNADTSSIPAAFQSVRSGNTNIQFCLAQRDPNGNPTTGIVRKQTSVSSFGSNDAMKRNSSGGSDAWDRNKYLNIWVCSLGGGLLGYAQFPGGTAATDGVVILNTAFGNTGTAASPFNKGRTTTHEVGHWLNLRHIWGDATCGNDFVNDTPLHNASNNGCPAVGHRSTCSGQPLEMYMNYMDYTNDACMYMFSKGQSDRMNAVLVSGGARASLATSNGCTPTDPNACYAPYNLNVTNITQTTVTLNWTPFGTPVSYNIQYKPSSGTTWTTVNSTATSVSISGLTPFTSYQFQVQAVCANSSSAYSAAVSFVTLAEPGTCVVNLYEPNNTMSQLTPLTLNLDTKAMIETGSDVDWFSFSNTASQPNIKVDLTNLPKDYTLQLFRSGTQVAISSNTGTGSESITFTTTVIGSYWIRVSGNSSNFSNTLCYNLKATIYGEQQSCAVPSGLNATNITTTTATLNWNSISTATSYNIQYRPQGTTTWTSTTSTSNSKSVNGLIANTTYEFQVQAVCTSGSSAFSTSVTFTTLTQQTCGVPAGLNATNITQTSATLNWTAVSNASSYNIQYRAQGTTAWTNTNATTNSKSISALLANTTYEFQVQAVCSNGSSAFSASATFTTQGQTANCTVNAYEPNNTMGQIIPISLNTDIRAMIEVGSDVDWYSFANTANQKNIQVRLSNLPKDYSLKLFKSGVEVASSANAGTADEVINYNTNVIGTYWIRVFGSSANFSNTQCYTVKASISATPYLLESNAETAKQINLTKPDIQLFPNPSNGEFVLRYQTSTSGQVNTKLFDLSGNEIYSNQFEVKEGENEFSIRLESVSKGMYLLDINNGTDKSIHKVLINK